MMIYLFFSIFIFCIDAINAQCDANINSFLTTANTQLLTAGRQDFYVSLNEGDFLPDTSAVVVQGASQLVAITRTVLTPQGTVGVTLTSLIPSINTVVSVVSSSAADASAGTGCRTVLVEGLDASGNVLSQTVTLNGVTPVTTASVFSWVQKITCATAGAGVIGPPSIIGNMGTITASINAVTQLVIEIGLTPSLINPGVSRAARYRVPTGKFATLKTLYLTMGREAGTANLLATWFYLRSQATITGPILTHNIWALDFDSTSYLQYTPLMNQLFAAGTVIWLEVISNAAVTTTTAFAEMNFLLTI